MAFEFVDNNKIIDPATRKRIRSHAAIGKNVGKKIIRPSRLKAFGEKKHQVLPKNLNLSTDTKVVDEELDKNVEDLEIVSKMVIERQIGNGLSVLSIPEQFTDSSKRLAGRALSFISGINHPPELQKALTPLNPSGSIWIQLMFLDEAYFHSMMAVSVIALNTFVTDKEHPNTALQHLSIAFPLINEKLSSNEATSNATLATVLTVSHCDRLQGDYRRGLAHLGGLEKLVDLRGGVSQMRREHPYLLNKVFKADLEYALYLGIETRFSMWQVASCSTALLGFPGSNTKSPNNVGIRFSLINTDLTSQLSNDLGALLTDIVHFAWLFKEAEAGRRPRLKATAFHETILLLGYRLIDIYPLGSPRPTDGLENALHLGLTSFILSLMPSLIGKVLVSKILADLLRAAIQENIWVQGNHEVLLWLLLIGKVSSFQDATDNWVIHKMSETMQLLDFESWDDVNDSLTKFPWIGAIHNPVVQSMVQFCSNRDVSNDLAEAILNPYFCLS